MKRAFILTLIGLTVSPVFAAPEVQTAETNVVVQPVAFPEKAFQTFLDQGRLDEADALLASLENKEGMLPVMIEYACARIAFARGEYTEALGHIAQVSLAHSRDSEWTPASVFLEGMIYQKTGQPEAAAYVAEELTLGWPGSTWSRRAAELKESKTE